MLSIKKADSEISNGSKLNLPGKFLKMELQEDEKKKEGKNVSQLFFQFFLFFRFLLFFPCSRRLMVIIKKKRYKTPPLSSLNLDSLPCKSNILTHSFPLSWGDCSPVQKC